MLSAMAKCPIRREIITVRGQTYVSCILTLHTPLRLASVYPPPLGWGGGGEDTLAGVGGQYFGRRETKDCPLTVIISLRSYVDDGSVVREEGEVDNVPGRPDVLQARRHSLVNQDVPLLVHVQALQQCRHL
jgi:hypothetical protein